MKNSTILIGLLLVALSFLAYRYFIFGKGNKGLSQYGTMFGWPRYDLEAAAKDGYYPDGNGNLVKK